MFTRRFLFLVLLCLPYFLHAAEILDFVPTDTQLVFRVDLLNDLNGFNDIRNDLLTQVSRQSGFDEKGNKAADINKLLQEIVIVTPNLTEDFTFVLVKTKMTEKEFCSQLEKVTGLRLKSVKQAESTEYLLEFQNFGIGSMLSRKPRAFAFAFLSENIAVFAKDSLSKVRSFKKLGLNPNDRKGLNVPKIIAAGYVKMDPNFLLENPVVPPFDRVDSQLAPGPAGSLRIDLNFTAAEKDDAKQVQKYLQQMVMVGALLLNQIDEELMQEWMASVKVKREHNQVLVKALFSRYFIDQLTAAANQQLQEAAPPAPPRTAPAPGPSTEQSRTAPAPEKPANKP